MTAYKKQDRFKDGGVVHALTHTAGFDRVRTRQYREGQTIEDMVKDQITPGLFDDIEVVLVTQSDRLIVPAAAWAMTKPRAGEFLEIALVPQGNGRKILRTVLTIAVIVAAYYFAPGLGTAIGTSAFTAGSLIVGIGFALINALIPPKRESRKTDETPGGGGSIRNRLAPGAPVPVVFGSMRFYPPMAALPITYSKGQQRYQTVLLNLGLGPVKIDDIRIGNQPLSAYDGVMFSIREGWQDDSPVEIYTNEVTSESLGQKLDPNVSVDKIITEPNTDRAQLEFFFPRGLIEYDNRGRRKQRTVRVRVEHRSYPNGSWAPLDLLAAEDFHEGRASNQNTSTDGIEFFSGRTENPTSFSREVFFPERGQYEFRITRTTSAPSEDSQIFDEIQLFELRSIRNTPPINTKGVALLALDVRLTDQKAGALDNVSVRVRRYYPIYENGRWVDPEETKAAGGNLDKHLSRNPAAAFYWAATGMGSKRPVPDSAIDRGSIVEFWNACDQQDVRTGEPRYAYDRVVESHTRLRDLLTEIARTGRARVAAPSGRLAVMRDRVQTVPKGVFTPRNTNNLSGNLDFNPSPHGIAVTILDRTAGYLPREIIAYADGYSETNAIQIERLEGFGITQRWRAWEYAKYYLENLRMRSETISFTASVDALHNSVGDYVLLKHDVLRTIGDGIDADYPGGRVTEVVMDHFGQIVGLRLDEFVMLEAGQQYVVAVRQAERTELVRQIAIQTTSGNTNVVQFLSPLSPGHDIAVGDLVIVGASDQVARDVVITDIRPGADLTATITVTDLANDIHDIDTMSLPELPNALLEATDPDVDPPGPVTHVEITERVILDGVVPRVLLSVSWQAANAGVGAESFLVYEVIPITDDQGDFVRNDYRLFGATEGQTFELPAEFVKDDELTIAVVAVSSGGTRLPRSMAGRIESYMVVSEGDTSAIENSAVGSYNLLGQIEDPGAERYYVTSGAGTFYIVGLFLEDLGLAAGDDVTFAVTLDTSIHGVIQTRAVVQFDAPDGSFQGISAAYEPARTGVSATIPVGATNINLYVVASGASSEPITVTVSELALTKGRAIVPYAPPYAPNATAGADETNLMMGISGNLLRNARFGQNINPWVKGSFHRDTTIGIAGVQYFKFPAWTLEGDGNNGMIHHPHNHSDSFAELIYGDGISVMPGERFEFSLYVISRLCTSNIEIWFYGQEDNVLEEDYLLEEGNILEKVTGPSQEHTWLEARRLNWFNRLHMFATAPPMAAIARPVIRKGPTNESRPRSTVFFTHAYFGRAHPGQTMPSTFSVGDTLAVDHTDNIPAQLVAGGAGSLMPSQPVSASVTRNGKVVINISKFTILKGDRNIEYCGGTVRSLSRNITYHVYCEDPGFSGVKYKFKAVKDMKEAVKIDTIYLGQVRVPGSKATTNTGSAGGAAVVLDRNATNELLR